MSRNVDTKYTLISPVIDGRISLPIEENATVGEYIVNTADNDAQLLHKASWFSCYANLTSTIIGAGILGLPYAFANSGWFLGSILVFLCALSSGFSLHFLAQCAKKTELPSSFYSVADKASPSVSFLIDIAVAIKCFGVATSYLIVIGDLMPPSMEHFGAIDFYQKRSIWILLGFAIVAPLSCLQSLNALKYTSSLSIVFILFLSMLIVFYALHVNGLDPCEGIDPNDICIGERSYFVGNSKTLSIITIFVFGYTCQQNAFSVVNEISNPTDSRMNSVFGYSVGTAALLYLIVAVCGYYAYGDLVSSDLLKSYPNNAITCIARIFVSLIVAFHYPLQCNPARKSVLSLWKHFSDGAIPKRAVFWLRYVIITVIFLGASLTIALSVSDLGIMLGIVGATGSTIVSFILPGYFYYVMYYEDGPVWKVTLAACLMAVGCIIMPIALYFIFSSI